MGWRGRKWEEMGGGCCWVIRHVRSNPVTRRRRRRCEVQRLGRRRNRLPTTCERMCRGPNFEHKLNHCLGKIDKTKLHCTDRDVDKFLGLCLSHSSHWFDLVRKTKWDDLASCCDVRCYISITTVRSVWVHWELCLKCKVSVEIGSMGHFNFISNKAPLFVIPYFNCQLGQVM